jgi:hypothetical protein
MAQSITNQGPAKASAEFEGLREGFGNIKVR